MRSINDAIEGADMFSKMMQRLEEPNRGPHYVALPDRRDGENRASRRARQRQERRTAKQPGKKAPA